MDSIVVEKSLSRAEPFHTNTTEEAELRDLLEAMTYTISHEGNDIGPMAIAGIGDFLEALATAAATGQRASTPDLVIYDIEQGSAADAWFATWCNTHGHKRTLLVHDHAGDRWLELRGVFITHAAVASSRYTVSVDWIEDAEAPD